MKQETWKKEGAVEDFFSKSHMKASSEKGHELKIQVVAQATNKSGIKLMSKLNLSRDVV